MKRYREFCTANACYRLHYKVNFRKTHIDDIEKFDAIVIETGFNSYEEWGLPFLLYDPQYCLVSRKNVTLKNPKPIFYVDIPQTERMRKLNLIGYLLTRPFEAFFTFAAVFLSPYLPLSVKWMPTIPLFSYISGLGAIDKTGNFLGYLSLSRVPDLMSYRSAISAKKIEEFIAPEIENRVGRKPNILIDFGAAHADMEVYLKHKKLRNAVLKLHRYLPLKQLAKDISYESKVCELRHECSIEPTESAEKLITSREPESLKGWEKILYKIDLKKF